MAKRRMPAPSQGQLESICRILGDTYSGLTGSEIGHMLASVKVDDIDPGNTKWKRLYNALATRLNHDQDGDRVFAFIARALEPGRFAGRAPEHQAILEDLNVVLLLLGYEFREDGRFYTVSKATTLSEAEARANRMRSALSARNVHPDVLAFCRQELMEGDCFHAVLEACKSVRSKIRDRTGLKGDGAPLIQMVFGGETPKLRINAFTTDSEKGEQRGFVNLATGLFGTFRNPTVHEPRIQWPLTEEDALYLFALASYVHRRIDSAV